MSDNERQSRHMWRWIAEETRRQKRHVEKFEYFLAFGIPKRERPCCDCHACREAIQRARDNHDSDIMKCSYCPIDWNNGKKCVEDGALFYDWRRARSYEDAAELAEKIAQMEWRNADE